MTAQLVRDIRVFVLRELYRVKPRGMSRTHLYRISDFQGEAGDADVQVALEFLEGEHLVEMLPADRLAPGLPPLWAMTETGRAYCEEKHLV
jgi:hypothetical protein